MYIYICMYAKYFETYFKFTFKGKQSLKNDWNDLLFELKKAEKLSNPVSGGVESISGETPSDSLAAESTREKPDGPEEQILSETDVMSDINNYINGVTKTSGVSSNAQRNGPESNKEAVSASSEAKKQNISLGPVNSDKPSNDISSHEVKHDANNDKHTDETKNDSTNERPLINNDSNFDKINKISGNKENNDSFENNNDSSILSHEEGAVTNTSGTKRQLNNDSTLDTNKHENVARSM
ncbi:transcription initiation factor TFIID subunit 1-like [Leptopilina heterotoma]|uniref:transcription initiation factor TFIID subunit 1-like n=1 Tax=Leptopilina heterotoma TaxID=63436 RepID=UPI001CAA0133|nr:transcription initiation factor TFIID subunit 1-like [Leptopilina heterotoma]